MNAVIVTGASAKEIAALVLAVQGRQETDRKMRTMESDQEVLIREYERRLVRLKSGESPGNVIFKV